MVGRSLAVLLLVAIARCEEDEVVVSKNLSELLQEVEFGKTAVLHCHSNDDGHFFLFWQLAKEGIVGPGNKFDTSKYNYEILTGNLFIRAITPNEEGTYHCVSRGVRSNDINIRSVRVAVLKDWEEVWEEDKDVNYFRLIILLIATTVLVGLLYLAYRMKKKHRLERYLESSSDEEDSAEELFRAPSTSRGTGNIVLDKRDGVDNPSISIDFENILNNTHNK